MRSYCWRSYNNDGMWSWFSTVLNEEPRKEVVISVDVAIEIFLLVKPAKKAEVYYLWNRPRSMFFQVNKI